MKMRATVPFWLALIVLISSASAYSALAGGQRPRTRAVPTAAVAPGRPTAPDCRLPHCGYRIEAIPLAPLGGPHTFMLPPAQPHHPQVIPLRLGLLAPPTGPRGRH